MSRALPFGTGIPSESYKTVFGYINNKGYRTKLPSREVYLKGPGMIFKGNPKNYLMKSRC